MIQQKWILCRVLMLFSIISVIFCGSVFAEKSETWVKEHHDKLSKVIDKVRTVAISPSGDSISPLSPRQLHQIKSIKIKRPLISSSSISTRTQLEDFTRFSKSHLWKLSDTFYEKMGTNAWSTGMIPFFVSSNPFIAKRYVQMLLAYLQDMLQNNQLNVNEPFYLIELGTGSGQFSFYFLKFLLEETAKNAVLDGFPVTQIKYIMTDFTHTNVDFWTQNEAFEPFLKATILDFAVYDATSQAKSLQLLVSGNTLDLNQLINPIGIIANYLFDTLVHDVFQVRKGKLYEGRISIGSFRENEPDPLDPSIIERMSNRFEYVPIENVSTYYQDIDPPSLHPYLTNILQWYCEYFGKEQEGQGSADDLDGNGDATVVIPLGGLQVLERLSQLVKDSNRGMFLLAGDKAYHTLEFMRGRYNPHIAIHKSFSLAVNFHAIDLFFANKNGFSLHLPYDSSQFSVCLFISQPKHLKYHDQTQQQYKHLKLAFENQMVSFSPDAYVELYEFTASARDHMTLRRALALIRLSEYDPELFFLLFPFFMSKLNTVQLTWDLKKDLVQMVTLLWSNAAYHLDPSCDFAYDLGRMYHKLDEISLARSLYQVSISKHYKKQALASFQLAKCAYTQDKDLVKTLDLLNQAIEFDPKLTQALEWQLQIQQELQQLTDLQEKNRN